MNLVPHGRENGTPARRNLGLANREFGFDTLQREIDRVFDTFNHGIPVFGARPAFPSMDVTESDHEIEISCELPGLEEKDVKVSLADGVLTIEGEKRAEKEEKSKSYQVLERSYGSFSRSITLPAHIDAQSVKASMRHGVLWVTVAKPQSALSQQIEITPTA